jgi:hypothetical protein
MPAAYQDQDGKWFKQCSKTGQLFGPVDSLEELGEWFVRRNKNSIDGFAGISKGTKNKYLIQYRQQNKNEIQLYKKSAKGLYRKYKARAKERQINFTLSLEWFEQQMKKPEFNVCYYSGIKFVDESSHAFSRSLDRISSTKGYTPDNVKWVCFKLNSWKSDLTLDEIAIMFNAMAKHHNVDPFEVLKKVA